ncbi:MAG: hypothetical protein HYY06_06850 [Deltaproteobacteria bacterium]|nr:hypothetical protein [Deltaproteobacteria bacterium]
MKGFAAGFASAIAASAALAVSWFFLRDGTTDEPCAGLCGRGTACAAGRCVVAGDDREAVASVEPKARGRRGHRRGSRRSAARSDGSEVQPEISDDMDLGPQQVDMEQGGERQLSNTTIEATMGRSFGAIRRCILVAQADREDPVHGRMSIGLRIRPTGEVGAVTVRPPPALATSDLGPCVRGVVSRIRFPSFDGREMAVAYPVTLD